MARATLAHPNIFTLDLNLKLRVTLSFKRYQVVE